MLNRFAGTGGAISVVAVGSALAFALGSPLLGLTLLAFSVAGLPVLLVLGLRRQHTQLSATLSGASSGDAARLSLPPGGERDATAQLRLVVAQLAAEEIALATARARLEARLDDLEKRLPSDTDAS